MHGIRIICALAALLAGLPGQADEAAIERGEYLTAAAGCKACHTDAENDGAEFAGGHALESPYGVFYTPNITPDAETGIGGWSEAEFIAAVREGVNPAGGHYYPAFPYASYAGMREDDARDIFAYLRTLEPVNQPNRPNELAWYVPGRWAMGIWKALFAPWNYPPVPADADAEWARGAYLVRHLGHCGECHTARNVFGALKLNAELAGSPKGSSGGGAPDITPNTDTGIGNWSDDELLFFFELGMLPDGDFVGGGMTAVVDDNTALLTDEDRAAMVIYLRNLAGPPQD